MGLRGTDRTCRVIRFVVTETERPHYYFSVLLSAGLRRSMAAVVFAAAIDVGTGDNSPVEVTPQVLSCIGTPFHLVVSRTVRCTFEALCFYVDHESVQPLRH